MERIRKDLKAIAEEGYREFVLKLVPNIDNVLGVRLPKLRKIAKGLAKRMDGGVGMDLLDVSDLLYFEEVMLQGMIIGYLDMDWKEKSGYIASFIPKIDNWSVCDSFCVGLKFEEEDRGVVWEFLQPYLVSGRAYEIRFAVVMLLSYFVFEDYIDRAFVAFERISHDDYYVKMAVAWAVSIYFRDMPNATMPYLVDSGLDDWTYNKALQKIGESLAVDKETKAIIRQMRR